MSEIGAHYLNKICKNERVHKLAEKYSPVNVAEPSKFMLGFVCSLAKVFPAYMKWSMKKIHDADPNVNDLTSVQIFWYFES